MSNRKPTYRALHSLLPFVRALYERQTPWPVADAAAQYGVTERTIANWARAVQSAYGEEAVQIVRQEGRRVLVAKPTFLPGERADIFDQAALALAGRFVDFLTGSALADGLQRVSDTVAEGPDAHGAFATEEERKRLQALKRKFFVYHVGSVRLDRREILQPVLHALIGTRRLALRYRQDREERVVEPLCLAVYKEGLYLVVRHPEKGHVFNLLVDAIHSARALGPEEEFTYPADWSPEAYRGAKFGITEGEAIAIHLRFEPHLWEYLTTRRWHPSQQVSRHADGWIDFRMDAEDTLEVLGWICSFGDEVEVVGPGSLRDRVAERLVRAAKIYHPPGAL